MSEQLRSVFSMSKPELFGTLNTECFLRRFKGRVIRQPIIVVYMDQFVLPPLSSEDGQGHGCGAPIIRIMSVAVCFPELSAVCLTWVVAAKPCRFTKARRVGVERADQFNARLPEKLTL